MSGSKTPTIIAITALAVAVLFATPLGQAAGNFVLAKNSVGAAQIKKNAVNGLKVKNGTLMAADFKAGRLRAGPQGPKGDPGPQGPKGDPGAPAATGLTKTVQRYAPLQNVGAVSCKPFGGWGVAVRNTSGSAQNFQAYVVCPS